MAERNKKDVQAIANTITRAMYEMRVQFELTREDLAKAVMLAAVSVGYSAWASEVVERLRLAADALEEDLKGGKGVFTQHSPRAD
jgi:predicted component of type VI protein secretion system